MNIKNEYTMALNIPFAPVFVSPKVSSKYLFINPPFIGFIKAVL